MINQSSRYFIPDPSHWPIFGSAALLAMTSGGTMWMNGAADAGRWVFVIGFAILIYMINGCFNG